MKWSVVALIVLGLVAGLCAALLVISLRTPLPREAPANAAPAEGAPSEPVTVLVAANALPSRTVVDASAIETRRVAPTAVPAGSFTDPVQVVGKVLLVPMTAGQPFTVTCFAGENAALRLASSLAPGSRAVSMTLDNPAGIDQILYPGCMVDVLTTQKVRAEDDLEQTLSFTLLQNVMVLTVGDQTIVDPTPALPQQSARTDQANLTLLLDSEQAEKLRLAAATGKLSVTMRNPNDPSSDETQGVRLGTLAPALFSVEEHNRRRREQREQDALAKIEADRQRFAAEMERQRYALEQTRNEVEIARERYEQELAKARRSREESEAPKWETVILRGGASETKKFPTDDGSRR
jgi:pilus assembly protein CpaB